MSSLPSSLLVTTMLQHVADDDVYQSVFIYLISPAPVKSGGFIDIRLGTSDMHKVHRAQIIQVHSHTAGELKLTSPALSPSVFFLQLFRRRPGLWKISDNVNMEDQRRCKYGGSATMQIWRISDDANIEDRRRCKYRGSATMQYGSMSPCDDAMRQSDNMWVLTYKLSSGIADALVRYSDE